MRTRRCCFLPSVIFWPVICSKTGMRRLLTLILFVTLAAVSASAQMVQDASYRVVGHIKSDGTIQDQTYKVIGHIKSNGTIQDSSYRIIGHVKSDGTVQDASYRIIGHTKGVPMEWAALYFFFPDIL